MRFTRLRLENWKNFTKVDVPLQKRAFLVGPNASGKSNLLDAIRFLRDLADPQRGFSAAVQKRGGVSHIRSLHARRYPNVIVEVDVEIDDTSWNYRLEFNQDNQGRPLVRKELVRREGKVVIDRPDSLDADDENRLSQTALEQVNANKEFRAVNAFFARIQYLHLVPQLVREPDRSVGRTRDPFGGDLLEQLADFAVRNKRVFTARMKRINEALRVAVENLEELELKRDNRGVPHLNGLYRHWRPKAGWQTEEQFSDGTLRLFGLLWAFLDGSAPLLLEEPELSLHEGVVRYIPSMMARVGARSDRQIIISTHSRDLLSDEGITPAEVLLLEPRKEGTIVEPAARAKKIKALLGAGVPLGEVVLAQTAPMKAEQLALFDPR